MTTVSLLESSSEHFFSWV